MDLEVAKALAHPVRRQILTVMGTETMSPKCLSKTKELSEAGLSKVSYHVSVLKKADLVELTGTKQVRGSTQHFYRVVPVAYTRMLQRREIPKGLRGHISAPLLQQIIDEAVLALESGTLDTHDESHLDFLPLVLDPEGCKEVSEALDQALDKVAAAHKRSADRLATQGEPGIDATVIFASFESGKTDDALGDS